MRKLKILIADDHQLIRETWALIINRDPRFSVIAQCSNGDEAIKLTQELRPDIAMLDINMSPVSGIEAAAQIRKHSPNTGIIAVSMHSQPSYVKKIMKAGAKAYVTKNSPQQELIDAIVSVSEGHRYICSEIKTIVVEQVFNQEDTGLDGLSQRELEVIKCLKQGLSSKEIAIEMNISLHTVGTYLQRIVKKLNLKSTIELVNFINASGLK